jgi:hypothetical protein
VRFASTALITREASERVKASIFWNSPRLRTEVASSSPSGVGFARDVGFDATYHKPVGSSRFASY